MRMPRLRVHDPGLAALRTAVRAAIVMPAVLAVAVTVIRDPQTATFAVFGSIAMSLLVASSQAEPVLRPPRVPRRLLLPPQTVSTTPSASTSLSVLCTPPADRALRPSSPAPAASGRPRCRCRHSPRSLPATRSSNAAVATWTPNYAQCAPGTSLSATRSSARPQCSRRTPRRQRPPPAAGMRAQRGRRERQDHAPAGSQPSLGQPAP